MEFVNKAYGQFADLVRSMTPAARVTTVALLATIAVSLGFLVRYGRGAPDEYLFGGRVLADREIARLEAAFSKAGLNDWETSGNRIRVPHAKRFSYIAAAADEGSLPDNFDSILEDMIKTSSPWEPKELREMRLRFAMQMEVAQVISAMKGIDRATVKFNEEKGNGFQRGTRKTAMVAAGAVGNSLLTREQVESIRRTVATTFGVPNENVVVTDLQGPSYPGSNGDGTPSGDENLYASHKQKFEQYYRDKIANSLTMIPGVVVGVNVELDTKLNQTTQTTTYNQPQTVRSSNSNSKTTTRNEGSGGRVGAVPNGGLGNRAEEVAATNTANSGSESTSSESSEESQSIVGQETTDIVQMGLTPTTVTATIQVPQSYFRAIWLERNPPKDGQPVPPDPAEAQRLETEETTRIKEMVQNLMPRLAMGKDPYPRVHVTTFVDAKQPEIEGPTMATQVTTWLAANWRTLAMFGLAVIGLVMLRSLARGSAVAPSASPAASPLLLAGGDDDDEKEVETAAAPAEAPVLLKRKVMNAGPNLRDELTDLVREDPDAAAAILSSWIGEAM